MNGTRLAAVLLLAAAVLAFHRHTYWRPFEDTPQESLASFHAYSFAAANGAGLGFNPIVARHVNIEDSQIQRYPHWPNGFFLVFEGVLRVFGRTETVGRSFAILGTLLGFTLVVVSLGRNELLVYATVPLTLLSGMGRDAVPFVFIDMALIGSVGALLWVTAHLASSRHYNLVFRSVMLAALLLNHLVAPYAVVIILLKWSESRSNRDLLIDLATLGAGAGAVLLALAVALVDPRAGVAELYRIFAFRSGGSLELWYDALNWDLRQSLRLEPLTSYLVAAAWLIALAARQWRTAILLPSFLLYGLVLREYVATHVFARLLLIFFSLLTVLVAVEVMAQRFQRLKGWSRALPAARALVAVTLAVRAGLGTQQYETDPQVQSARHSLMRIVNKPENAAALERCNAFRFVHIGHRADPHDRIGQFFFAQRVVERIRRGEPVRRCLVDLEHEVVREHPP